MELESGLYLRKRPKLWTASVGLLDLEPRKNFLPVKTSFTVAVVVTLQRWCLYMKLISVAYVHEDKKCSKGGEVIR